MKKLLIIFIMFAFAHTFAQSNAIKVGPVALAFSDINASFEHQFSEKMSVIFGADYWVGFKLNDTRISSFSVKGGVRYYLIPSNELAGFYLNPRVSYNTADFMTVGATLGYQWHWDNNLILDTGVGPNKYIWLGDSTAISTGIAPMVTLAIGYAF